MITQTKLSDLLIQRLDLWDEVDRKYDEGLFVSALELTNYIENDLTPRIRKEYCL
jgi:hypothetical protein